MFFETYKAAADRVRTGRPGQMDEAICAAWDELFRPRRVSAHARVTDLAIARWAWTGDAKDKGC